MDEASIVDPLVGVVLQDRYRILDKVADGSMGAVYRAERLQLGRRVAVKFLHKSYAQDPSFIQRFERETVVMSKLAHPHCVSVIDFGVQEAPYVVMEYVSGRTLRSVIEGGRLSVERSVHVARQVLAGLAHAHAQGIVHRDIKPANIMLSEATGTGEHVRILDFGLATLRDAHSSDLSQSMIVVGTPNYMSPEQSLAGKVDGRSDIYSTGICLFEMLTGHKPYNADDTYELLLQHRNSPIPRLTQVTGGIEFPAGLQGVIDRALAKEPQDRFANAIEFAEALEEAAGPQVTSGPMMAVAAMPSLPPRAAPPPPIPTPPILPTRGSTDMGFANTEAMRSQADPRERKRGLGPLSTLVALGLIGGAGWLGWKTYQARQSGTDGPVASRVDRPGASAGPAGSGLASDAGAVGTPGLADAGAVATQPLPLADAGARAVPADGGDEAWPMIPEEEREEPVEAVDDEAEEVDESEPTIEPETEPDSEPTPAEITLPLPTPPLPGTTVTPPAEVKPDPIDTVSEAVAAIRQGKSEEAIQALRVLRKKMPKSAYVPYLLGNLYMAKRWWTVGMDHYRAAIRNNGVYRGKRILNQNVIRALASAKVRRKAAGMLVYSIGRPSLPYLKRAFKYDRNRSVRKQAWYLYKRIRKRRR
jgi:eukaryotic-like serine/threonine-protein kinase